MNDLLKKLNVLVKASIRDVLGDDSVETGRGRRLPPYKLGKDIDREIAMLRGRINDALAYEDELQGRVNTLQTEVATWDEKADAAISAGDDTNARYAIDQMQRTQQRTAIAEADLRDHQQVTQELIFRVNTLESAVADARNAEVETAETPPQEATPVGQVLSDALKDVREKIGRMGDLLTATQEMKAAVDDDTPVDDQTVDDELEVRRQRLSKPK
jgi:phage shock protein A